jgi:hypothetical protein
MDSDGGMMKEKLMMIHNILVDTHPTGDDILKTAECIVQLRALVKELDEEQGAESNDDSVE